MVGDNEEIKEEKEEKEEARRLERKVLTAHKIVAAVFKAGESSNQATQASTQAPVVTLRQYVSPARDAAASEYAVRWDLSSCVANGMPGTTPAGSGLGLGLASGEVFIVDGLLSDAVIEGLGRFFAQATVWHYPTEPKVLTASDKAGRIGLGWVMANSVGLASDLMVQIEVGLEELLANTKVNLNGTHGSNTTASAGDWRWRMVDLHAVKLVPGSDSRAVADAATVLLEVGDHRKTARTGKGTNVSPKENVGITIRIGGHDRGDAGGLMFSDAKKGSSVRVPLRPNRALIYDHARYVGPWQEQTSFRDISYGRWAVDLTFVFER